jgi:hypothetical protein
METITKIKLTMEAYKRLNDATDNAIKAGCLDPDGPLFEAIWKGFDTMLSCYDKDGWISWYIYETNCGKQAKEVTLKERTIKVTDIETLAEAIKL